jgi:tetratricopeptide (TPR) repeat protein
MITNPPPDLSLYPPFDQLPEDRRRELASYLEPQLLEQGEVLFYYNQPIAFGCFISVGRLELLFPDGHVEMANAGDWLGWGWLASDGLTPYTVRALGVCEIWKIMRSDWIYFETFLSLPEAQRLPAKAAPGASRSLRQLTGASRARRVGAVSSRRQWAPISRPMQLAGALGLLALCLLLLGPLALASLHRLVVSTLLWTGSPTLAQTYLQANLSISQTVDLHDMLGRLYLRQGDLNGAIDQFQQAVKLDDEDAAALNNLAVAELSLADSPDRLRSAAAHLQQAVELDPTHAGLFINLGNAWFAAGDAAKAAAAYSQAYQLDPTNLLARTRYADMLASAGHADEAKDIWLKILADPGASPQVQIMAGQGLGMLMTQQNEANDAISILEAARAADSNNCRIRLYLGIAYEAADQLKAAGEEYSQALILCPMSPVAGDTTARLLSLLPRLEGR